MIVEVVGVLVCDWFWNEYNFVFCCGDLYFYGKGVILVWVDFVVDVDFVGWMIILLNMVELVLIVKGLDVDNVLGFSFYGVGCNWLCIEYMCCFGVMIVEEVLVEEIKGFDVRFVGKVDVLELLLSYKFVVIVEV